MKTKRRDFLKVTGMGGLGLAGASILQGYGSMPDDKNKSGLDRRSKKLEQSHVQRFNMSGYAAPKLSTVRVGIIGLGNRGSGQAGNLGCIEGVDIRAICDIQPEKAAAAKKMLEDLGQKPAIYTGNIDEWKKLCEREDIDLVIVSTPWYMHAGMALYAMEHGKHVGSEVVIAATIEECWQLVETSERTRKHCMMMGNINYGKFEVLTLSMARQGFFGEIVHGECAYIANKIRNNFSKTMYWDMWWLKQYASRKGNIYPVHGLGGVCQIMDINRGDKMDYLVSVESRDFKMGDYAKELSATDDFYKPFANKDYRGNINTSVIKTSKGRTIIVQHDPTSYRPDTYIHGIYGTTGSALEYPLPPRISKGDANWVSPEDFKLLEEKYTPNISKKMGELGKESGYNISVDFIMMWRFIDCLRNGLPLDMDLYDGVSWSSILPLSEWSVNNRSNSIDVPDFTKGAWKTNKRNMDITLAEGGDTKLKKKV